MKCYSIFVSMMPKAKRPFFNRWDVSVLRFKMKYVCDAAETDYTTTIFGH